MLLDTTAYQQLCDDLAIQKQQGKVIVLATGIFDLLHAEHRNYLKKAKQAGDVLVVAIESDARTKQLKGDGRPVQNEEKRLKSIQALPYVDAAFILPDEFSTPQKYEELITDLQPSIYAVSSSSPYLDSKRELLEKHGGKLMVVHQHNPNISTTQLLTKVPR